MEDHKAIVKLNSVNKIYEGKVPFHAVRDASFEIRRGGFAALAGRSGSGKTTLLNLMGAIDRPTSGVLMVDDMSLSGVNEEGLDSFRRGKLGFIFQNFNLIPVLSALENVEYPLLRMPLPAKERTARARELLEAVGLGNQANRRPSEMSGGQRQRVAIARALVKTPKLLLADEPTANLDRGTAIEVIDLLGRLNREMGTTIVFSTHDPLVIERCQTVVRLEDGRVLEVKEC